MDIIGKKFFRLTVLEELKKTTKDSCVPYYKCQCDCGNIVFRRKYGFTKGSKQNCGCYNKEIWKEIRKRGIKQRTISYIDIVGDLAYITLSRSDKKAIIDKEIYEKYDSMFKNALSDNLNTSNAITVLYDVLKADTNNTTKLALIESFDKVLSLDLIKEDKVEEIDIELLNYINTSIEKRKQAKLNKDFALADSIRQELLEKGIILKDTREGTTFEVQK